MITEPVKISQSDIRRLLSAANPDAALLYLYINSGNRPEDAEADLHFSAPRYGCAAATLRQLGLWPEDRPSHIAPGERPSYCEKDVLDAMDSDNTFRSLYGEVQRLLGRSLNTEELKILLGFVRYLGLTADVISLLVCYCKERARQRGSLRNPSLRTIEKEAYNWAERGIDTVEEAAAFIQAQNVRNSRLSRLMNLIQIRGRSLTAAEERYAQSWLDMGMDDELIAKVQAKYPWYSKFTIPAGTYDGQTEPVQTTAVKMLLLTDASMPDDVVYDLAKTFWENLDSLGKAHAVMKTVTKEMAVSDLSGIPLHPGAEKYYREIGLLK